LMGHSRHNCSGRCLNEDEGRVRLHVAFVDSVVIEESVVVEREGVAGRDCVADGVEEEVGEDSRTATCLSCMVMSDMGWHRKREVVVQPSATTAVVTPTAAIVVYMSVVKVSLRSMTCKYTAVQARRYVERYRKLKLGGKGEHVQGPGMYSCWGGEDVFESWTSVCSRKEKALREREACKEKVGWLQAGPRQGEVIDESGRICKLFGWGRRACASKKGKPIFVVAKEDRWEYGVEFWIDSRNQLGRKGKGKRKRGRSQWYGELRGWGGKDRAGNRRTGCAYGS
ncbi:hypothetical protein KCU62_g308, partial [Aureobasidium sp. EXF-3399]